MPSPVLAVSDLVDRAVKKIDTRERPLFKVFALSVLSGRHVFWRKTDNSLDEEHLLCLWNFYKSARPGRFSNIQELTKAKRTCLFVRVPFHAWSGSVLEQLLIADEVPIALLSLSLRAERDGLGNLLSVQSASDFTEDLLSVVWDRRLTENEQKEVHLKVKTLPDMLKNFDSSLAQIKTQSDLTKCDEEVRASNWRQNVLMLAAKKKCQDQKLDLFLHHTDVRYQAAYSPSEVLSDFYTLKESFDLGNVIVRLSFKGNNFDIKIYHCGSPISLSVLVDILGNIGLWVNMETSFRLSVDGQEKPVVLHHLSVTPQVILCAQETLQDRLEETLRAIFCEGEESDTFQKMILCAGLTWQEVRIFRAYVRYLKQLGVPYGRGAAEETLVRYPHLVRQLVTLFHQRLSPKKNIGEGVDSETLLQEISQMSHYDEERLFRGLSHLIMATVRTNFYQNEDGQSKPYVSLKFDCTVVEDMPEPRPLFEIFVYASFMEGVHLRSGRVSRGGLRWSDRKEDYRDEVLDLLKTQIIKNAVIVPVGAKGGFVSKKISPPVSLAIYEVPDAYTIFIKGLLDVTDNVEGKEVIHPLQTVCLDDPDPYLVVAADKGTATRSDDANVLADQYHFWLGDAFASGGTQGYDHKKIGITARGAWCSVEHHFRTLGISLDKPFSVVGVGDMSGDVFGNGMLLSKKIRLQAAFDHRDIFLDPDPDSALSYKERKRLFLKKQSSWRDYDRTLISKGGGVFSRSLRMIPLSAPVRAWLGIQDTKISPDQLIQHLLKAPVDLLWFGGIGTFIKGEKEPDISIADSGNNRVRVNASDVQARVIVEGANLGLTSQGRVEYALKGGQINTDALDNAAGVTCSDYEVNIKILCALLEEKGQLSRSQRDVLLKDITSEVVELVLRRIFWQNQAIGFLHERSGVFFDEHVRLINALEKAGFINKKQHFLPFDEELQQRQVNKKEFSRPELSILLACSKIALHKEILASDLPDDAFLKETLLTYFPQTLSQKFSDFIGQHPLRREIISTILSNLICDMLGPSFVNEVFELTRAPHHKIAKAIVMVRALFYGDHFDFLEMKPLERSLLSGLFCRVIATTKRLVVWFLRHEDLTLCIDALNLKYADGFSVLRENIASILSENDRDISGPWGDDAFARTCVWPLDFLMFAPDIIQIQRFVRKPLMLVARVYYQLADLCGIRWLREQIDKFPIQTDWEKKGLQEILEQTLSVHQQLTLYILSNFKIDTEEAVAEDLLEAWCVEMGDVLEDYVSLLDEIKCAPFTDISPLVVLGQEFRRFYERVAGTCIMTVSFT